MTFVYRRSPPCLGKFPCNQARDRLVAAFSPEHTLVGIAVIAVNLLLSSILVWLRRHVMETMRRPGPLVGFFALFIGSLTIVVIAAVVLWGYKSEQQPNHAQNGKIVTVEVQQWASLNSLHW
jgi:hypothetical protein